MLLVPSVAEITVGIVCACVPVAFPLFKSISSKSSSKWHSWRQYLKSKPNSKSSPKSPEATENVAPTQCGLPRVPKGNLSTLLSFIQGPRHGPQDYLGGTKSQQSITVIRATDIEMAPYSELRIIETSNMYHSHLYQQGSHKTLVSNFANVSRT